MKRHQTHTTCVVPVLLRPVDWQGASFARLPVLPRNGQAITTWPDRDKAFLHVAQEIRNVVETITTRQVMSLWLTGNTTGITLARGTIIYTCDFHARKVVYAAWSPVAHALLLLELMAQSEFGRQRGVVC